MPWYEPAPSVEELDFWKIEGGNLYHQVAKWPHSNTVRVNPKFRVKHVIPTLIPIASKWGVFATDGLSPWNPLTPDYGIFGWAEAEVRGTDHLGFVIPESDNGWELDVNIKGRDDLDFLGGPGIEIEMEFAQTDFGTKRVVSEWPWEIGVSGFRYNQNTWFIRTNPHFTVNEASENWPDFWNPWMFAADE
jgi:hypothetical protein